MIGSLPSAPSSSAPACVEVYCWGQQVGTLFQEPAGDFYVFEYTPEWILKGVELAPLHLANQPGRHLFKDIPHQVYHRLPAFIADSLPDQFGTRLIELWLRGQGKIAPDAPSAAMDRLLFMGDRAMGALEFRPTFGPQEAHTRPIEVAQLVRASQVVSMEDGEASAEALFNLVQVGSSAGGQRAKAVIAYHPETGDVGSGQVLELPEGFSHWLIKLDGVVPMSKGGALELGVSQGWGRVEYAYSQMALEAGIRMSECRLLEENGRAHFITRRFDRENGQKHHVSTLCAMDHLDYTQRELHTYESLFSVIDRMQLGQAALDETFRRMAFNVMGRNHDDHTKNFAFLIKQGGQWELSPAYDITYANNPTSQWVHQHLMSVNGKFKGHTRADLLQLADAFGVSSPAILLDQVRAAIAQWPRFSAMAGVDPTLSQDIQSQLRLLL